MTRTTAPGLLCALIVAILLAGCTTRRATSVTDPQTAPDESAPAWDAGQPVPDEGQGEVEPSTSLPECAAGPWTCNTEGTACSRTTALPSSTGTWHCHMQVTYTSWGCGGEIGWLCYGYLPVGASSPADTCGWTCDRILPWWPGHNLYRCRRPAVDEDFPPNTLPEPNCRCVRPVDQDDGHVPCVACEMSSFVGGTVCYSDQLPYLPPFAPPDRRCEPGASYWCSGLQFSGWGQFTCLPDGSWPTKVVNGQAMLDCQEMALGHRPATVCACYHHYYNPSCCERADCMVPKGTEGWLCPPSEGRPCEHCDPQKPECQGGRCVVSNAMETFCAAACDSGGSCPAGTHCMQLPRYYDPAEVCIPDRFTCYWEP